MPEGAKRRIDPSRSPLTMHVSPPCQDRRVRESGLNPTLIICGTAVRARPQAPTDILEFLRETQVLSLPQRSESSDQSLLI